MNTNNRTGIILRCFVIVIAVLSIFALVAGGIMAHAFFHGEGVAPLKWPIGTAAPKSTDLSAAHDWRIRASIRSS